MTLNLTLLQSLSKEPFKIIKANCPQSVTVRILILSEAKLNPADHMLGDLVFFKKIRL